MFLRKIVHLSTIFLLLILKHLTLDHNTKFPGIIILSSLTLLALIIEILRNTWPDFKEFFLRSVGRLLKEDEIRGKPTGATFLLLSMTLAFILFEFKIFYYATLIAILVDGITPILTLIIFKKNFKDHSHLIVFLISAILVAFLVNSGLPLFVKLTASILISLTEYINPPPDDNLYAEFVGAFIIYILLKIFVH